LDEKIPMKCCEELMKALKGRKKKKKKGHKKKGAKAKS